MKPRILRRLGAAVLAAFAFSAHAAAPMVIGTDFTAVPTNTTGYNGHGGQATVFIKNFPAFTDWGVGSHIYLLNPTDSSKSCEVYAYDSQATPPWDDGTIPKQPSLMGIRFQIGNMTDLAACAPAYGSPLNIDVVVGGVHATSNRSDVNAYGVTTYYSLILGADAPNKRSGYVADYEPLTITPINGQVLFVDPNSLYTASTADGSWAKPFPNLQEADGFSGALKNSHSGSGNCPSHCPDGTPPATQIVMRGGNHHLLGSWPAGGNAGRWANFIRTSGVAAGPNQWQGPIDITSWDGGPGSNASEIAVLDQSLGGNSDYAGGFYGPDSPRAIETNYWDTSLTGWGKHIQIAWVKVIANPHGPRDGAPFNLNYGSDDNRLVAVEGVWQATTNTDQVFHCAGICGDGIRVRTFLNGLHDIGGYTSGVPEPYTNHGIYIDSGKKCADDFTVAFTSIKNVWGGNDVMANASGGYGGNGATGDIQNIFVYGNWMEKGAGGAGKNNLTFSQAKAMYAFNNVMIGAGDAAVNVSNGSDMATNGFQVFHNDILDWDQLAGGRAAFWDQGSDGSGNWDARNNIIMRRAAGTGTGPWYIVNFNTYNFLNDTWWDATSSPITQTIPDNATCGTSKCGGQKTNPKFVGANTNTFTLGTTSPAADFGTSLLGTVPREFDFMLKTQVGTAWDGGAYERQ